MSNNRIRLLLGLDPRESEGMQPTQLLRELADSWFSTSRSTESMMRGTVNEDAVLCALKAKAFVRDVFAVGMLASKDSPWRASSPDGVALIDLNQFGILDTGSANQERMAIAGVEIKTSVASSSLDRAISHATADVIICDVGDSAFRDCVPEAHMGQLLQQMYVIGASHAIYLSASETGILYITIARASRQILDTCAAALTSVGRTVVSWAHESTDTPSSTIPAFADAGTAAILKSRIHFWKVVDEYLIRKGPLPPIKVFKHGTQSIYSKTKGGVDGSAQARAVLRSSTSSLHWEQKIVTQTLKTLAVNAFISYRMEVKSSLLETS
jgi:hypothetical protein